jgi:hypothetical protein
VPTQVHTARLIHTANLDNETRQAARTTVIEALAGEFPDAQPAGGMDAIRKGMADVRGSLARGGASLRAGIAGHTGGGHQGDEQSGSVGGLERLAALHARGALTDEEFAAAKRELLSS